MTTPKKSEIVRPLPFFSNGFRLDADLHLPDDGGAGAPYPAVIACSGYQGQKTIHPERFARALVPNGFAVLAFDYRGFGLSEGERGRLVPQEWAEDIRAGVDRLVGVDEVDANRMALIGWGLGGGVVVAEAADDPRICAVVSCNAVADGHRSTKNMHDAESWASLVRRVADDRPRRTAQGRSEIADPWDITRLNLDRSTDTYVADVLYRTTGFGTGVTLESADYLLRFSPERVVDRLAPRPLLIVHGARNELYAPIEAESLFQHAGEPKRLVMLPDSGHTEWMFDDNPVFQQVAATIVDFLSAAMPAPQRA